MPRKYAGPLQPGMKSAYVPGTRTNRPKRVAYKKEVPTTTKETAYKNAKKISLLESKVNGHVQKGYHNLSIRYNPVPGGFVWGPKQPLLFALNDFYTQTTAPAGGTGSAYFPIYSGVSPNITMVAGIMNRWADYVPGNSLGFSEPYQQWKDVTYSQPSRVGYQPLYSDVRVVVDRTQCTPQGGDWWIRIDSFKAKRTYLSSSGGVDPKLYNMPNSVGAFSNLAVAANVRDNEINPALWTRTQKTRWIKLKAPDVNSRNLTKVFHIKSKFPKTFLKCNLDIEANQGSQFWQFIDPKNIHWCMLSLSKESPSADDPVPQLYMTRHVTWRDSRGIQM